MAKEKNDFIPLPFPMPDMNEYRIIQLEELTAKLKEHAQVSHLQVMTEDDVTEMEKYFKHIWPTLDDK